MEEAPRASRGEPDNISTIHTDWGPLVHVRPVFTTDSKYLIAASGSAVKLFSTTSGSLLEERHYHEAKVVGVVPSSVEENQFVSCDESGVVCFWNFQKKKDIKKFVLLPKENSMRRVASFNYCSRREELFLLVQICESQKGNLLKFCHPFKANKYSKMSTDVSLGQNKFAVSHCESYIAHVSQEGLVVLGNDCSVGGINRRRHLVGDRKVTCVIFHPSQDAIATGDITGRVVIWYEFMRANPIKKELHWHTQPVADLAFSFTGKELYSGGGESVLVKWQLSEDQRSFLPRLGLNIKYVATDIRNNCIATAHVDNSFTIISAKEYMVEGIIQGLAMNVDNVEPFPAGIVYDPRTRAAVLNGRTGHVQFYDFQHCRQLFHLDITLINYYTQERYQKIHNTDVEHLAVSPDGHWLATIEYRDDHQTSLELRLKFWNFKKKDQNWYLNTCIEMPHDKYVNGITFQPSLGPEQASPLCVTCGDDGRFKVWQETDTTDIYGEKSCWSCCGIGFYRHLPATAVRMSHDGSLIAAGFGSILTFWLPSSCNLKGTLSQPYLTEKIKQIEFGRGKGSESIVVTRTEHWVCAWDLFTCTLSWRVSICSTCLAADPLSSYMAVFSAECDVFVFEPRSSELVSWQYNIDKHPALSAVFVPHLKKPNSNARWNEQSALIYINRNQTLQILEVNVDLSSAKDKIAGRVRMLVQDTEAYTAPTPFAALVAQTRVAHNKEEKTRQSDSATFGIHVEKSTALIQEVLNEARVYRLDSFAHLSLEFCKMIIPEAVNSEEKQMKDDFESKLKEREEFQRKTKKKISKGKKKILQKVTSSDFSDLMSVLTL
ncbi:WD repeat-containing protein 75 [Procambarus clarkii]|uniref:WD repeat-containing protein 75 n=1 Tax=Procambarus clarkii TaxID=6728 RepID=UPI001E677C8B|nr:WD repeat-containing protein 75-like [Procambarus clarkii]